MNLLLLYPEEISKELASDDPRALHVRDILKAQSGDRLKVGVMGGRIGTAQVEWTEGGRLQFSHFELQENPPPPLPLSLIIGTPRPPTARRLLRDLTSLGVGKLHWTSSELGERSYLHSPLWVGGEWRLEMLLGAMQGRTTLMPHIEWSEKFHRVFEKQWPEKRFYLSPGGSAWPRERLESAVVAVGPERGFTVEETARLEREGFAPLSLGPMTLRTETAALGAAVLARELWFSP